MKTFIIISVIIFLSTFITLVVYIILTLLQIKDTAKEAEAVLKKINKNLENVTQISDKITIGISSIIPLIISLTTLATSSITKLLKNLFFGGKK